MSMAAEEIMVEDNISVRKAKRPRQHGFASLGVLPPAQATPDRTKQRADKYAARVLSALLRAQSPHARFHAELCNIINKSDGTSEVVSQCRHLTV